MKDINNSMGDLGNLEELYRNTYRISGIEGLQRDPVSEILGDLEYKI
jgi:hypothetical protein